ncbi:hypothetical protein ASPCAL06186 [Aspergillus calidoustus]|uniref:Uncharacterized protein n=1 Tax=Aspergillus calidoustus TaxID=454130 RepID=A0A0U5C8Q1_ASPCI|nr:hypothetical protein ASPCAL06186 [Aspergillus calidoustus]
MEATPTEVDPNAFPQGTIFTQLAATKSATFVLTSTGSVYGWGTFRGSNAVIGFSPTSQQEPLPVLIDNLENVAKLVAGAQHMLALTSKGRVFPGVAMSNISLGDNDHTTSHLMTSNQQHVLSLLTSGEIGSGHYHSFAIHKSGDIYAWGLSDYEQTTMPQDARFEREMFPKKLHMLKRNSDNPRETQESFRYRAGNITATLSTKTDIVTHGAELISMGLG